MSPLLQFVFFFFFEVHFKPNSSGIPCLTDKRYLTFNKFLDITLLCHTTQK